MLNILLSWKRLRALNDTGLSASVQVNGDVTDPPMRALLQRQSLASPSTLLKTVKMNHSTSLSGNFTTLYCFCITSRTAHTHKQNLICTISAKGDLLILKKQ